MPAGDKLGGSNTPVKQSKEIITLLELSAMTGLSKRTFYRLNERQKISPSQNRAASFIQKIEVLNYITFKYGKV